MILGYLWLVAFSRFNYDHALATISAFGSALAFLVPALFVTSPIRQRFTLSERALGEFAVLHSVFLRRLSSRSALSTISGWSASATFTTFAMSCNFLQWLGYAMGATTGALLPFAFACFVARGNRWRAAIVAGAVAVVLSDHAHQAGALCAFLADVSVRCCPSFLEARTTVVLSLFLPISIGVIVGVSVTSAYSHTS